MAKTIDIDEYKCNGCGLCVDACHEGALELVKGKAKLVRPNFCDGMGDCLPACPQGAISFVETGSANILPNLVTNIVFPGGTGPEMMTAPEVQWPIQLGLVSCRSEFLKGDLVIGADCTAFKIDNFQTKFVKDKPLIIGCPKLDPKDRFDKLVEMFRENPIYSLRIVRMEVPCCSQLTRMVKEAVQISGKDIEIKETVIRKDGRIIGGGIS
jgi:NAD-dependent dihydropyrimidine dehydrogenase PreA subunit